MTPERMKLIRDGWANAFPKVLECLARDGEITMDYRHHTGVHLQFVVTRVDREITWSAVCEGLELASYRK